MDIGTRIAVAVLSVEMGSVAQAQTTTLSCAGDEATALRQAPLGASRVSLERLTVNWAGGSTVLADSGAQEGYIGGTAYLYCGFSPTSLIVATVSTRIDRGKKTEERDGRSYDSSYCGSGGALPRRPQMSPIRGLSARWEVKGGPFDHLPCQVVADPLDAPDIRSDDWRGTVARQSSA
jgi:hypothetical protein